MGSADILHLTLERQWFDEIARGKKKREYREFKPYWTTRLEGRTYKFIKFRNGYSKHAPEMLVEFRGLIRESDSRKARYVIKLGRVRSLKRWPPKE